MAILRNVCGDPETFLSVPAGASLECAPIDLDLADVQTGTLTLDVGAGSGMLKLSAEISADGVSGRVSVGDLITGVVDGSPAVFNLSDAAFSFSRYLIMTVTETGGVSPATARSVFQAQER